MKKNTTTMCACIAALCLLLPVPAHPLDALDVSGANYTVYIYCLGSAGEYCSANEVVQDEFIFDQDGTFSIASFDSPLADIANDGDYSEQGSTFTAFFEAINEDIDRYEFNIDGVSFLRRVIIGTAEVGYYEPDVLDLDFDLRESTDTFFLGLR